MDDVRNQLTEVNRFSFSVLGDKMITRVMVLQDNEGFFHINEETISDTAMPERKGIIREDIHGKMTIEDYNRWLTNALFNACYIAGFDKTEKNWLMHD